MTGEKYLNNDHLLKECILLSKLDKESAKDLLALFHEEKWAKNSCILNSTKLVYHFYIIISGRIKMYQVEPNGEKELTLFILCKNDVFDLFCLLDGQEHSVFYECLDDVKVLAAPMENLRNWLNKNPQHYVNLLPYAGKQLRMLENYVSEFTFTDISTRLLKLLIRNANNSQNLETINDLSNKEIAYLIGSTRAVVNRHLQQFKRNGSIKISRNRVEIRDLSLLINLLELHQQKLNNKF